MPPFRLAAIPCTYADVIDFFFLQPLKERS
jgi:hypothetical protein